jgi:UDP-N-acetylmuramate dehydrogenase
LLIFGFLNNFISRFLLFQIPTFEGMLIKENFNLRSYNTFGVDCIARQLVEINEIDDLYSLFRQKYLKVSSLLILGEGSNVLFTKNFDGLVIKNSLQGKEIVSQTDDKICLKIKGGENWSDFVDFTVEKGFGGVENLSLIPGTVGAAPIQNIGAYGVELRDMLITVEVFDLKTGEIREFSNSECEFGYRTSIFKTKYKGRFLVVSIVLKILTKPILNLRYAPLQKTFRERSPDTISVREVSEAVKSIRRSKLPDPSQLGNAGSFFKNPVVSFHKVEELISIFPDMPFYKVDDQNFKVAAGWLIEKSGWKGKRIGDAGVHDKQALVIVNYGKASGLEIFNLSQKVRQSVYDQFGIQLEREVTVL